MSNELTHLNSETSFESWIWRPKDFKIDQEALDWISERPKFMHKTMINFPPSCVVKANVALHTPRTIPAIGLFSHGIVSSWFESGKLGVRQAGWDSDFDMDVRAQCKPEWLEVVGFWRGVDHEEMKKLLKGIN